MNKIGTSKITRLCTAIFIVYQSFNAFAQVEVAPFDCYNFSTIDEMNNEAASGHSNMPFATWKAAYDYAIANSITTINFAPGTYYPGGASGLSSDWGDASGGFPLNIAGMTVNGNGAIIDNSANANTIAFTTLAANGVTLDGFTFIEFTAVNAGAVLVNSGISGWTISNCNFDHCDWSGDGLVVSLNASSSGTIESCNFYNHIQSTGSAMTISGAGGQLDINNSTYSCNSRIVAGGAMRILNATGVTFEGCIFDGNETNSASGGAISIEDNSEVVMNNTDFICNEAIVNVQDDGGAIHVISGSSLTLSECNFSGNKAQDKGGAIHVSGGSASLVTIDMSLTDFYDNQVITATTYGGAIYMDGFSMTSNISDSHFENNASLGGNTNGGGGGLYLSGGTGPGELTFDNNTFIGNTSGNGNGNAIRTEIDFQGTGNSIAGDIFTQCTSPGPGFFNFGGDGFVSTANWTALGSSAVTISGGRLMVDASDDGAAYRDVSGGPLNGTCAYNTIFSANSEIVTWTFTASNGSSLEGFDGSTEDGMAFVIGADGPDFFDDNTSGYSVIFGRNHTNEIELTHFSGVGGLSADANHTQIAVGPYTGSGGASASVRVTYDPASGNWTLDYDYNTNSNSDLDTDPRGDNGLCMGPAEVSLTGSDNTYTGISLDFTGFAMSGSSAMLIDFYHTRLGDGCTDNSPGVGSGAIQCVSCLSSPGPIDPCEDQGSISGVVWDDGIAADGQENANYIAGATVSLYLADGTLVATVITNADGEYYFGGLADGDYYVEFTMPAGFVDVTFSNTGNAETDNDIDGTTMQSHVVTITTSANAGANSSSTDSTDGTTGAAHYTNIDAGFTQVALPIVLADFRISQRDCTPILEWVTETEINNERFEIQRSMNGVSFEVIGTLKGGGTTYSSVRYKYEDSTAKTGEEYYYRLKQIDFDGRFSFSDIVSQRLNCNSLLSGFNVYPTLIEESNSVKIESKESSKVIDVRIVTIGGQEVYSASKVSFIDNEILSIDTKQFRSGIFFLTITDKNQNVESYKIIKL